MIFQLVFVNDVYLVDLNNTYRKFTGIDSEVKGIHSKMNAH